MAPKKFLTQSPSDIEHVAQRLQQGAVFALPTETVYGLAADALNPDALEKIFQAKGRPHFDPLIIHIAELEQAEQLATTNSHFYKLAQSFWPGPLTLILPKKPCVPDLATANKPTVALRMPAHPTFREVLKASQRPLAAPSANAFGYVSPTTAEHVFACLGNSIDGIMDTGPCEHGIESTILDVSNPNQPTLYRPGPISTEMLETCLKQAIINKTKTPACEKNIEQGLQAPGLLSKHYSPKTPIELVEAGQLASIPLEPNVAYLHFCASNERLSHPHNYTLTKNKTPEEAARMLYQHLRTLDSKNYERIIVEKAPKSPLGQAINNRLKRAAKR